MSSIKRVFVALSIACFPIQPQVVKAVSPTPVIWSNMIWNGVTTGGQTLPHAALLLNIGLESLGRTAATMQLDTGTKDDVLYTKTYESLRPKETPGDRYWIGLTGTVAGRSFKGDWFRRSEQGGPAESGRTPLLGTIGAAFFERRILLLDFVARRVAILGKGEDLADDLARRFQFVPLEYRDGKMFVAVNLNGAEDREMFFDSGSSAMAVLTTRHRWIELTGRQPGDQRNSEFVAESQGNPVRFIGAPLKGSMNIGTVSVEKPVVYFEPTGLPNFNFEKKPYKTSGLFGNLPFDGRFTVVVDLAHKKFGIFEGSLAESPVR